VLKNLHLLLKKKNIGYPNTAFASYLNSIKFPASILNMWVPLSKAPHWSRKRSFMSSEGDEEEEFQVWKLMGLVVRVPCM